MDIIERIYELFEKSGKKPSELCKVLDIQQSTMSTWKTRHKNPPAENMQTIANFFGVSLSYLMTGQDVPPQRYTNELEDELLELFRKLPPDKQHEYIGDIKGYLRAYAETIKYEDNGKKLFA